MGGEGLENSCFALLHRIQSLSLCSICFGATERLSLVSLQRHSLLSLYVPLSQCRLRRAALAPKASKLSQGQGSKVLSFGALGLRLQTLSPQPDVLNATRNPNTRNPNPQWFRDSDGADLWVFGAYGLGDGRSLLSMVSSMNPRLSSAS